MTFNPREYSDQQIVINKKVLLCGRKRCTVREIENQTSVMFQGVPPDPVCGTRSLRAVKMVKHDDTELYVLLRLFVSSDLMYKGFLQNAQLGLTVAWRKWSHTLY